MLLLELEEFRDIQVLHVHGVNADAVAEELAIARPHADHHVGIICNHLDAATILSVLYAAGVSQTHSQPHYLKLHAGHRFTCRRSEVSQGLCLSHVPTLESCKMREELELLNTRRAKT